jgi:glc operon protein GlcG
MRIKSTLDLGDADLVMTACRRAAEQSAVTVSIAVVDDAGVLLCFARLDGAKPHTVELAQRKARTTAMLGVPTSVLEAMARDGRLASGEALAVGGGAPVKHQGQCVGGVGVSGATSEIDERIAVAGAVALQSHS